MSVLAGLSGCLSTETFQFATHTQLYVQTGRHAGERSVIFAQSCIIYFAMMMAANHPTSTNNFELDLMTTWTKQASKTPFNTTKTTLHFA